jgi:hypothetical protein
VARVGRELVESVLAVTLTCALIGVLLVVYGKPVPGRVEPVTDRKAARPGAASPSAAPASPHATPAPVAAVPVVVLNSSRVTGLAARAAAAFRAGGWPVRATGNYGGRIAVTTVYYPAGQEAAARAFAARFPAVRRVRPRPAGLPGSGLTVVVTRDFRP